MRIIAILDRSAGNETVGEMWQETRSFDENVKLIDVLTWAAHKHNNSDPDVFNGNLRLTVDQSNWD